MINFHEGNLILYYNLIDTYTWINEFEIYDFDDFVEWYNNTDKEEVIYNLLNMLHEEKTFRRGQIRIIK